MKSNFIFIAVSAVFLFYFNNESFSQIKVTKVVDKNINTSQDGFYYSLPQTILKVDLAIEKIQKIRGPLADYAKEYLGTSDFINANSVSYRLANVTIEPSISADPQQVFYVQLPAEKPKDGSNIVFQLTPYGTLKAFDEVENNISNVEPSTLEQTFIMMEGNEDFRYFADYNRKKKVDTIVRKITIDTTTINRFIFKTSWVDKSSDERANEAAMQIAKIRESRFNLISGFQEVNYGESMYYMDDQIRRLEQEYLELFLGKEVKTIENHTIYYIPVKGKTQDILLKGINGSQVDILFTAGTSLAALPENPQEKNDNIYYRIPELATIEIFNQGSIVYSKNMLISQFGVVSAVPVGKTRMQFDPLTGSLIKIVKE